MLSFIMNTKFLINGQQIACRVTGEPNANLNDGRSFVLMIPDGPGFHSTVFDKDVESMLASIKSKNKKTCHFILFDPLGCGDSDKAIDPENEYTMANFTVIAAKVVETVQRKLCLERMDLTVYGIAFGGMIAINMPVLRPVWLETDSAIRLGKIITSGAPNTLTDGEIAANKFVDKYYRKNPSYKAMKLALKKIFSGTIQDQPDYLKVAIGLAPLYSDKSEQLFHSLYGNILRRYPVLVIALAGWLGFLAVFKATNSMLVRLTGFNVDVFNQFSHDHANRFNLIDLVAKHKQLFAKVAICCMAGNRDCLGNAATIAKRLQAMLPQHIGVIVFDGKHSINGDSPLYLSIIESIFSDGVIDPGDLHCDVAAHGVDYFNLPNHFKQLLRATSISLMRRSTTTDCLANLGYTSEGFVPPFKVDVSPIVNHMGVISDSDDEPCAEHDPTTEDFGRLRR